MPFNPYGGLLYAEVFIPFPQDERYMDICEGIEQWTAGQVHSARPVFIAGPGEEDSSIDTNYFGQWAWFYGFDLEELLGTVQTPVHEDVVLAEKPHRSGVSRSRRQTDTEEQKSTKIASKRRRKTPYAQLTPG